MLDDGTYDAIVFDADGDDPADAGGRPTGAITVELTILDGPHKGETISLTATGWAGDPLDLLGIPATITVADGRPSVAFEP